MNEEKKGRESANDKDEPGMNPKEPSGQGPEPGEPRPGASLDSETAAGQVAGDIETLQKQLEESDKLSGAYKDQLLRLAAEFENFRKRTDIEKAEFVKYSNERIIKDLIPILDDFERALVNGKKSNDFDSFYKGVEMIYQKLQKVFEEKGVKPIESVGREFDVNYHDVLMQVPKTDVAPHTVVEEIERGYTLHGRVIKHAKVIVSSDGGNNGDSGSSQ